MSRTLTASALPGQLALLDFTAAAPVADEFAWSASRLRKVLQCPRQFRYAYVDKLPTVPGAPMVLGRILHEIICYAHEIQMETGILPPAEELLGSFESLWPKVAENIELRYPKAGPPAEEYLKIGREMIRVFRHTASLCEPPLAVELAFDEEVEIVVCGETRKVRLRGVIDRLDEVTTENGEPAVAIVDYKSGRKKLGPADARAEIQLTVYTWAVQRMLGLPVARVELLGLRDGEPVTAGTSEPQLDWLVRQVLPYAQDLLERGEFPPCPGYWCKWCDYAAPCEAEGIEPRRMFQNGGDPHGTAA